MFSFKESYQKKIKGKIEEYCEVNYQRISHDEMTLGNGLFNHRCQWNAVQQVKEGCMDEVYLCVCFNGDEYPVVHFINKKGDKYIDNTLGYKFLEYNYYIIRKINEFEYEKTNDILYKTKRTLIELFSNKLLNKLFGIDVDNLGI